jgi:Ser/Thr protein kinase RdoA (MazF antagonist)
VKPTKKFELELLTKVVEIFFSVSENYTSKKLSSFNNIVYELIFNDSSYIIRLSFAHHRILENLLYELQLVRFLFCNGLSVGCPIISIDGKSIEIIELDEAVFYASCFTKVAGEHLSIKDVNHWGIPLATELGSFVGKMHSLMRKFDAKMASEQHWKPENIVESVSQLTHPFGKIVLKSAHNLAYSIENLDGRKHRYGLIHGDFHAANFRVLENQIHAFDFDSVMHHWIDYDIAVLYSHIAGVVDPKIAACYLSGFFEGYTLHCHFENNWLNDIHLFIRLRDLDRYVIFCNNNDLSTISGPAESWFLCLQRCIMLEKPSLEMDLMIN